MNEKQAIALLRKEIKDDIAFKKILAHSKKVKEIALRIAKKIPDVDIEFIKTASLLHDIGRGEYRPKTPKMIRHGLLGAEILRKHGLEKHALVAERHIGAGISKEDIEEQGLDLPKRDFLPVSKEEKIIADADNFVFQDREGTIEEIYDRYIKEIKCYKKEVNKKVAKRCVKLHEEVMSWCR